MSVLSPVATALPANPVAQRDLLELARQVLPERPGKEAILAVFENARIAQRSLAMPVEWYLEPHGHRDRAEVFARVGLDLVESVARTAIEQAGLHPKDIDAVVMVSTTGMATPSLEARLMDRIPLRPNVERWPLVGLGCAGGVGGLRRADALVRSGMRHVLLICMELCSIQFDLQSAIGSGKGLDKKSVISASLFGDGCAGLVVSHPSHAHGPRFVAGAVHRFPDSERVMGWDVQDHTLDVVLSPGIPDLIREHLGPVTENFRQVHGPFDAYALHPGGAKVLDAIEAAWQLQPRELAASAETLRQHGNMSSPTVLFTLGRVMQEPGKRILTSALGPAFASEIAVVQT